MSVAQKQAVLYKHTGQRIKERRKTLRITQSQLAERLDISYQQVQKYETGLNQISLGRLLQFAQILNVTPDYFYQGFSMDEEIGKSIDSDVIPKIRTKPFQILLVEDNITDVLLFKKALQEIKHSVVSHCISDPETVMDYLQSHSVKYGHPLPDIILLDLNLPKITGLQLLKEIKGNSQTSFIPVLMLTNSISRKEMLEAYRIGASGFVQKSVDFVEYTEAVATLLLYWSKVVTLPVS